MSPTLASLVVSILAPDGTTVRSTQIFRPGGDIDTDPLPATGTYTIVIDPEQAATGSVTLNLSSPNRK